MRWMPGATSRWSMLRRLPPTSARLPSSSMSAVAPAAPFILPPAALDELRRTGKPFGVYVHVPWCASRCGYCDFNTYVPGRVRGAEPAGYAATAVAEAQLMGETLTGAAPPAGTVFFG